jgi:uncharacterized Ntn-hydrolase superfamily protein
MTYSIVARDPSTGELGVAVQSHYFSVGPVVPWAAPGVGAVATQSMVEISYGPKLLELLGEGVAPQEALARLLAADGGRESRQVAVVSAAGEAAAHTGSGCLASAGHVIGPGVSCQGNIMASERVWHAMLTAYEGATGPLADRLMAALDAAEAEGGDLRGRQSAALLVVPGEGEWWRKTVELRVEDDPEPLVELRRLLSVHRAYELANRGDDLLTEGRHDEAARLFQEAYALAGDNHELLFWAGLGTAQGGDLERGAEQVRRAIAEQPGWAQILKTLPESVSPVAPRVAERLGL